MEEPPERRLLKTSIAKNHFFGFSEEKLFRIACFKQGFESISQVFNAFASSSS